MSSGSAIQTPAPTRLLRGDFQTRSTLEGRLMRRVSVLVFCGSFAALGGAYTLFGGGPPDDRSEGVVLLPSPAPAELELPPFATLATATATSSDGLRPETRPISDGSPDGLRTAMLAEPRDPQWAPTTESSVRERLDGLPVLESVGTVTCATSICELTGQLPSNLPLGVAREVVAPLHTPSLRASLASAGLVEASPVVTIDSNRDQEPMSFRQYFVRARQQ